MFGIGTSEFLVIIIVAVLVLGPEHLPRIVRTVTKIMSDFRRISSEIQRAINLESYLDEEKKEPSTKKKKKKAQTDGSSMTTTKNSTDQKEMKSSSENIKNDNLSDSPSKQERDESNLSVTDTKESEEKGKI